MNLLFPSSNVASTASGFGRFAGGSAPPAVAAWIKLAAPTAKPESRTNSRRDTGSGTCIGFLPGDGQRVRFDRELHGRAAGIVAFRWLPVKPQPQVARRLSGLRS